MLATCQREFRGEGRDALPSQQVRNSRVAGVQPASALGSRPNFSLGALTAGIIAARWSERKPGTESAAGNAPVRALRRDRKDGQK